MRTIFPLSSQELNDVLIGCYERYLYLLGYDNNNVRIYSGIYDIKESEISSIISDYAIINNEISPNPSGVPLSYSIDKYNYNYNITRNQNV